MVSRSKAPPSLFNPSSESGKNGDVGHVGEVNRHILAPPVPLERLMLT